MELVPGSSATQFGIKDTNYCGPGYTNGKLGGGSVDPNGDTTGPVDATCKAHDSAYEHAENSATPAADRLAADTQLVADVAGLLAGGQLNAANMQERGQGHLIRYNAALIRGALAMPTISMFYGLIVRMLFMDTQQHLLPHLHVEYQGSEVVVPCPKVR